MAGSTINSTVTVTVTLGSAGYPSPLTVAAAGAVSPTAVSAIGVVATVSAGMVLNHGTIDGADGAFDSASYAFGLPPADAGGAGVLLTNATLTNNAAIAGGIGGSALYAPGGAGGDGVDAANARVTNAGTGVIAGGLGGTTGGFNLGNSGGNGGAGVKLTASYLLNSGNVTGGGGSGISLADGSTARNTGIITGGEGNYAPGAPPAFRFRYSGGFGAYLNASTLINDGSITGGNDAASVRLLDGAMLTNDGTITGGSASRFALGGFGVDIARAEKISACDMAVVYKTSSSCPAIHAGTSGIRSKAHHRRQDVLGASAISVHCPPRGGFGSTCPTQRRQPLVVVMPIKMDRDQNGRCP